MSGNQFDTIYHEHFSYFSFHTLERLLAAHGLTVFDVDELPTHGGSLGVYAQHTTPQSRPIEDSTCAVRMLEEMHAMTDLGVLSRLRRSGWRRPSARC